MIKILDSKNKNFNSLLEKSLLIRKNNIRVNLNLVKRIIEDIKKNGDKALLKYEKKFSNNSKIYLKKKKFLKQKNNG